MPSWIVPSDSHTVGDTGHTTDHNHMADDLTIVNNVVPVVSGGLTGATGATRYAGATASGHPSSGTFAVGDFVIDQTGAVWVCTAAGSPGTWASGVGFANPMTTLGDSIYGGSSGTATRLAGNTTTTRKFWRQTGTGSASAAPAWDTLVSGDIPSLAYVPVASDGHSPAPVVILGGISTQQGQWQAVVSVSLTAQFFSAATVLQVQGGGGGVVPSTATVRFAARQAATMGSAPAISLTADECQVIAPGNFWAVVTSNTGSLTTVTLYLQAPIGFESYNIRELAQDTSGGGTLAYAAGGSTWLSSLPSGAQQYAVPGPSSAAAHMSGPLAQWLAALAGRHYAPVSITCLGTSITAGNTLSAWELSWPVMLQDAINQRFPSNGLTTHGRGMLIPVLHGTGITPDYLTVTGTPTAISGWGCNGETYDISAGGGCTLTYHLVGTTAYIYWTSSVSGGSFTYKVDSGSPVTVSTSAGSRTSGNVTGGFSLGSAGAHTLTITWLSGGSVCIDAVLEFNGDENAGLQIYNAGSSGATTPNWQSTDLRSLAQNFSTLWFVELGVNDWGVITPAAFQTDLAALIGDIRTACANEGAPDPVIVLLADYLQDFSTTDQWQQYVAAMYAVAGTTTGTAILDLTQLMPPSTGSGAPFGLYATDGLHPSQIGHSMIADLVLQYLSPQAPA